MRMAGTRIYVHLLPLISLIKSRVLFPGMPVSATLLFWGTAVLAAGSQNPKGSASN